MSSCDISIIVPVYNEQESVIPLYEGMARMAARSTPRRW